MTLLKLTLKKFTTIAMVVTLFSAIHTAQAEEPIHNFKMATGWAGGPLSTIGAQAFADNVNQLSDGRIKVQVFTGGALGNALKVSETVKNGVAEMGHTWMGYDWGKDPTTVLFGGYAEVPIPSECCTGCMKVVAWNCSASSGKSNLTSSPSRCSLGRRRYSCTLANPSRLSKTSRASSCVQPVPGWRCQQAWALPL